MGSGNKIHSFYVSLYNKISRVDLVTGSVTEYPCCHLGDGTTVLPNHDAPQYMIQTSSGSLLVTTSRALFEFDTQIGVAERVLFYDSLTQQRSSNFNRYQFFWVPKRKMGRLVQWPGYTDVFMFVDKLYNTMFVFDLRTRLLMHMCKISFHNSILPSIIHQPESEPLVPDCGIKNPQDVIFLNSTNILLSEPHAITYRKLRRRESV